MSLRDLIVSIDFDDINIKKLLKVDNTMDDIEDAFSNMEKDLKETGRRFEEFDRKAGDAMDDLRNDTEKANDATDDLNNSANHGGKSFRMFGSVGAKAMAGIAAAATAAYTAIVMTVNETQTAFDRLEAKTGATGRELEELKGVATDVFKDGFGENLTQVNNDVAMLQSMFKDLKDGELTELSKGIYTVGDLFNEDTEKIGWAVKNLTSNFKDLSEQQALDLITTGFQKTGDYADDLLDTFKEYSPYFAKMGMSAQDFTGILVKGSEAGAWNLDKVADAVKEFGIRAMDGSDGTIEGFDAVGLNADMMADKIAEGGDSAKNAFAATIAGLSAMENPVERNIAGVKLFGTQWEDVREDVILSMDDAATAVAGFEGATDDAADAAYNNFGRRMGNVFRDLKMKIADTFNEHGGEELLNSLATKAEELVPKIEDMVGEAVDFADAIKDNWPQIKETTIGVASAVGSFAAIMGGLKVVGLINTLMVAYRTGTVAATLAQWGFNTALLANPMSWVVVGISALIGAGVALYRNWDTVKEKAGDLWSGIKDSWGKVEDKTAEVWYNVKKFVIDGVNGVVDKINDMIETINKVPGVEVPIVPKVESPKMPESMAQNAGLSPMAYVDGSHAAGLNRVPYDGYVAELHKDEAVVPAKQANNLRGAGLIGGGQGIRPNQTFAPTVNINVSGGNGDAETIAQKARKAARDELESFWRQMVLKQA